MRLPAHRRSACHDGEVAQPEDPEDAGEYHVAPAANRVRAGTLLLASTDLLEPTFRRSVIYVVEHNDGGTLGVVLNRPSETAVHNVLPHMVGRGTGDILVTSSLAAHFPTPWEPVYASSKWAIDCFVQTVRRQMFKHGIRVGSVSPGPVITSLLSDWPAEKLAEAKASGSLIEAAEVAEVLLFMLTRPRGMTIRDVVLMPTNFDL